jgi:class 3 adenylate cyclase
MKEAEDPQTFAAILQDFVERGREAVLDRGGIYDKFTGDGLLAYWSFTKTTRRGVIIDLLETARTLHETFRDRYMPLFRANSQTFPENRIGLGIGLDDGHGYSVAIAGDPTIVGPCVVGAVRMVHVARSGETLANVHLGSYLQEASGNGQIEGVVVEQVSVPSKEYDGTQTAFALRFK